MSGRPKKPLPPAGRLNFLLGASDTDLDNFELARLAQVANLRSELHAILDKLIDEMAQAAVAGWFRQTNRERLKQAILETPDAAFDRIMARAKEQIRDGQRSQQELIPRTSLTPGAAHLAAALRYQERNMAEGKCSLCPEPLDRNSVRFCTKHLAMTRDRDRQKKGLSDPGSREYLYSGEIPESTHGRTRGTLASLAMNREQKTRALLAELGVPPESAAVSLKVAVEAIQKCLPRSKADALTQAELFEKAGVITKTTGGKALAKLLSAGQVHRFGKGVSGNPYRYFTKAGS
jgi:hypothetical protein